MQMAEGQAQGLDYRYEVIDLDLIEGGAEALSALLDQLERRGFTGINVTHPCKQQIIPYLTDLSPDAEAIGAVNTVVFGEGRRVGYNTDWWGYAEAFARSLPAAPLARVVLLGAGGAGAAVAYALATLGAGTIQIFDSEAGKARLLADSLPADMGSRFIAAEDLESAMSGADGVVHATPTGMSKYPGIAIDPDLLQPRQWVSEIVYVPLETELVRVALGKGCLVSDGSGMAVFQAVKAFELFTGLKPDIERMYAHFNEYELA
jgi:shikimate dehydrogenase